MTPAEIRAEAKALRELSRQVKARKRFLKRIINPVLELVRKRGTVIHYSEHSCHTNVISELRNFGGFSFHTDCGQSMMGGDTVQIWHHPKLNFREGGLDSAHDPVWTPVLEVNFWTGDDHKVVVFDKNIGWHRALDRVLQNQDKIAAQIAAKKTKVKKAKVRESGILRNKDQILKDAKRLSIISG